MKTSWKRKRTLVQITSWNDLLSIGRWEEPMKRERNILCDWTTTYSRLVDEKILETRDKHSLGLNDDCPSNWRGKQPRIERTIHLDEKSTDVSFEDKKMLKKKEKSSLKSYGETTNLGIDDENTLERKEKTSAWSRDDWTSLRRWKYPETARKRKTRFDLTINNLRLVD